MWSGCGKTHHVFFHACFSAGMFVGAASAAGFIALDFDLWEHLVIVAVVMLGVAVYALRYFLPDKPLETASKEQAPASFNLLIVVLGCGRALHDDWRGLDADWTPLYMTRVTGSPEAFAPFGQASFSGAMLLGRGVGR